MTLLLAGCATTPIPPKLSPDPVTEAWYRESTLELKSYSLKASAAYSKKDWIAASALIESGEKVSARLLSVPKPTLEVAEASADIDELYGRMLLRNQHYGWARLQFQKNLARWKHWQPRTPATESRLQKAQAAIDECDRQMERKQ